MINKNRKRKSEAHPSPTQYAEHSRVMSSLCGRICGFGVAFVLA